ncbi:MAG: glycosyltransferase family 39 protein [Candidatus Omnitrophica bacterium]|nr:glycosyltransferase family 39 protein [Candidatus Omnitrophota bacterium]
MRNKVLLGIIISGLIIKIAMLLILPSSSPETWEYETIANNILEGHGYQMERLGATHYSSVPPLYPFICAGIYALTNHSYLAVQLFQIILSCLVVLAIYIIGKNVFNRKVGLLAAFLTTFHPGLMIYTIWKIHPLLLDSFLILLVVLVFLKACTKLSLWKAFLSGAIIGLTMLTRSTVGLFLPFGIAYLALSQNVNKKKLLIFSCALLISTALIIAPWIVRNYSIHKQIIFTTATGELLWRGNNIEASGSSYLVSGKTVTETMPKDLAEKIYGKSELVQRDVFMKEAFGFIKKNPDQAIKLFVKKFYHYWWFSPQSGILYLKSWLSIYKIYYTIIIMLGGIGLYKAFCIHDPRVLQGVCLLLLMLLAISLAQSLFYVEGRHRWAIEPIILIFSANGIFSIGKYYLSRK